MYTGAYAKVLLHAVRKVVACSLPLLQNSWFVAEVVSGLTERKRRGSLRA